MNIRNTAFSLAVIAATSFAFTSHAEAQTVPAPPQQYNDGYDNGPNNAHDPNNPYCREYTQTFSVGGKKQTGYGTACQQPDGSWKVVSENTNGAFVPEDESYAPPPPPPPVAVAPTYVVEQPPAVGYVGVDIGGGYYGHRGYYPPYYHDREWR